MTTESYVSQYLDPSSLLLLLHPYSSLLVTPPPYSSFSSLLLPPNSLLLLLTESTMVSKSEPNTLISGIENSVVFSHENIP